MISFTVLIIIVIAQFFNILHLLSYELTLLWHVFVNPKIIH